jgi:hypothetical protein
MSERNAIPIQLPQVADRLIQVEQTSICSCLQRLTGL